MFYKRESERRELAERKKNKKDKWYRKMAGKTFYGDNGEIERICYREGCYWKRDGKCGDNGEIRRYGKMCIEDIGKKCEKWREDYKWSDKTQY